MRGGRLRGAVTILAGVGHTANDSHSALGVEPGVHERVGPRAAGGVGVVRRRTNSFVCGGVIGARRDNACCRARWCARRGVAATLALLAVLTCYDGRRSHCPVALPTCTAASAATMATIMRLLAEAVLGGGLDVALERFGGGTVGKAANKRRHKRCAQRKGKRNAVCADEKCRGNPVSTTGTAGSAALGRVPTIKLLD